MWTKELKDIKQVLFLKNITRKQHSLHPCFTIGSAHSHIEFRMTFSESESLFCERDVSCRLINMVAFVFKPEASSLLREVLQGAIGSFLVRKMPSGRVRSLFSLKVYPQQKTFFVSVGVFAKILRTSKTYTKNLRRPILTYN